jgi:FtsH-binding integral membrane protein
MEVITSVSDVALFIGLTALDIQCIKLLYTQVRMWLKKLPLGVRVLYLNYINLFLYFLHFLGKRKRND